MVVVNYRVALGERSYDAMLGEGVRHQISAVLQQRAPRARHVAIVTTEIIRAQPWFDVDVPVDSTIITIADGEAAKELAVVEELCLRFARAGMSRHDVVIAVGGGALTDVAGFAASVYLRGVGVIQVPTSLVGQVDAAIGGKTAVNLSVGKNLVGAFHQPLGVLCDLDVLATLPPREVRNGMGEIAKCWLLDGRSPDAFGSASMRELVDCAVSYKAAIVSADEREGGARALLNYGHTLAHALEAETLAGRPLDLRHGEAVAIGTAFAIRLAQRLGRVDAACVDATLQLLHAAELPTALPPGLSADALVAAMASDKKAHHDLTFVLAGPTGFDVVPGIDAEVVRSLLVAQGANP